MIGLQNGLALAGDYMSAASFLGIADRVIEEARESRGVKAGR